MYTLHCVLYSVPATIWPSAVLYTQASGNSMSSPQQCPLCTVHLFTHSIVHTALYSVHTGPGQSTYGSSSLAELVQIKTYCWGEASVTGCMEKTFPNRQIPIFNTFKPKPYICWIRNDYSSFICLPFKIKVYFFLICLRIQYDITVCTRTSKSANPEQYSFWFSYFLLILK